MSQAERFTYSNPPHWANPAITDWQLYDDGERISVADLVDMANQQEACIQSLLAEINLLRGQAGLTQATAD